MNPNDKEMARTATNSLATKTNIGDHAARQTGELVQIHGETLYVDIYQLMSEPKVVQ